MNFHSSSPTSIQRDYYAQTAKNYDAMHLMDQEHNEALEWMSLRMQQLNLLSILDIGCGTGRGVKFSLSHGFDAIGIEPVQELLETGRQRHGLPPERMLQGSGEQLPFEDKSFDATIELGVLHHVRYPKKIVAEMMRVSRRAIFISDCNRFGQGRFCWRLTKLIAWKLGLWPGINFLKTSGKGYTISEEDGLAYSYSVYDSLDQLTQWADKITIVPTSKQTAHSWLHPLLTTSHVLLIAERNV